ncbi:hypothetical protein [Pseudoalteromonas piscicida]|uniref:hypothetical protein n=1 Tax=Pseudoalteromonas piscicida TaxID=43662 RepID=UPI001246D805|nr:hypothetical protein [Pseudoalteromonas piscicida]
MSKSANPDLGHIQCDGCSGMAAIRRQRTGRQYLYLHCPNCGMDKRSGHLIQAKWEKAIKGEVSETLATETPTNQPVITHKPAANEWTPTTTETEQNHDDQQSEAERDNKRNGSEPERKQDDSGTNWGAIGRGVFAGLCAVAGIRVLASS